MALAAAKIKAILFDIDGTLSDTDDQMMKKAERMLSPLRLFLDDKKAPGDRSLAGDDRGIARQRHL